MPELPEVETTRRGIAPLVVGRRVVSMRVYDRRLRWSVPTALPRTIAGRVIDALDRRSKYLLFRLGEETLLMHFGMTGSLRAYNDPPPRALHDHVDIVLDSGVTLRYRDPRRFGAMLWLRPPADAHPLLARLGLEPFDPKLDAEHLWRATRNRAAAVKLVLMDNHVVVGVGNIYASEALYRAGIRPTTPAKRLSRPRLARLVDEVRATLSVYDREGLPCRVCNAAIRQIRQGGRATYFCPRCQK
jgi:formamidopyrimidine-DNA glycosylase